MRDACITFKLAKMAFKQTRAASSSFTDYMSSSQSVGVSQAQEDMLLLATSKPELPKTKTNSRKQKTLNFSST